MKHLRSKKSFIENAFCNCSKCNRFFFLSKHSFYPDEKISQQVNNNNAQTIAKPETQLYNIQANHKNTSTTNICLHYNKNKWLYLKHFEKLIKYITSFECISFPLCPSCCARLLIQIKMQKSSIENTKNLFRFLPEGLSLKIIESSIQNLRNEASFDILTQKANLISHKSKIDSYFDQKKSLKEYYKINDSFILSSNYPTYPDHSTSHFSLTLVSSFWISTDKHYITINNVRIGFYGFRTNTIEENNIGLKFLSHLMWALSKTFGITFRNFEILPFGAIRTQKNTLIYLKIPEPNQTNEINSFNLALDVLFYSASALFTSQDVGEFCGTPPFEIDVENHLIASISYKYGESAKSIEDWSIAMRLLLFNLKLLQIRSSSQFLTNS